MKTTAMSFKGTVFKEHNTNYKVVWNNGQTNETVYWSESFYDDMLKFVDKCRQSASFIRVYKLHPLVTGTGSCVSCGCILNYDKRSMELKSDTTNVNPQICKVHPIFGKLFHILEQKYEIMLPSTGQEDTGPSNYVNNTKTVMTASVHAYLMPALAQNTKS